MKWSTEGRYHQSHRWKFTVTVYFLGLVKKKWLSVYLRSGKQALHVPYSISNCFIFGIRLYNESGWRHSTLMGTHSSPVDSAGGYRFYQFTALPCNMATVPLQFTKITKVAKEVKLMAFAEGISIRQYIGGWLMKTSSNSNARDTPIGWCILSKAWVGSQISKNQIYFQLH